MSVTPVDGPLGEIQAFCNTAVFLHDEDAFASRAGVLEWTTASRERAVAVREAVRSFLEDGPSSSRMLNSVLSDVQLRWSSDGTPELVGDRMTRVVATLFTQHLQGNLGRLKVCNAPECRWVFYDRSPNNASIWCRMSLCGSRHKMRAMRARRARSAPAAR